jgi:hypothetical protein
MNANLTLPNGKVEKVDRACDSEDGQRTDLHRHTQRSLCQCRLGSTLVTASGQGTFFVNKIGNTITLSNYTALTSIEQWRWQAFGTHTNTGPAPTSPIPTPTA